MEAKVVGAFRDYHEDRKCGSQNALIYEQAVPAPQSSLQSNPLAPHVVAQAHRPTTLCPAASPQSNPLAPHVVEQAHRPTTLRPAARKSALCQWIEADLLFC